MNCSKVACVQSVIIPPWNNIANVRYKFCLQFYILYISYISCYLLNFGILDLIDAGALPILTAIQKISSDDVEMCILLARILSNMSLHSEYLETIYESGKTDLIFRGI